MKKKCYYSQPPTYMRTRRLFEAPVSLLTELRLLMQVGDCFRSLKWKTAYALTCEHVEHILFSISAVNSKEKIKFLKKTSLQKG